MRTSEEIYHRVRWDPRFDPARFVLGINLRGTEPKRMPLPKFVPGGDIPWHRVLFIEADGEVVWDRAAGIDHLDRTGVGRVRAEHLLTAPFFTPRAPWSWDDLDGWSTVNPQPAPVSSPGLRVLTWNSLWDRYDSDRIDTARRRPLLLAALAEADADVIALQEVESELWALLRDAPWVRAGYTLCGDRSDVDAYGLVILSRRPVREAAWHALGPHKAVAAVTVETDTGPVVVFATHLTSNHTLDGGGRRERELVEMADGLSGVDGDVIVVGDFNDATVTPATVLRLRDAWTEAHGEQDTTPTFDPTVNPLAAISSLTGWPARLDRVLLRGELRVATAALLGVEPVGPDGLFISDHAGVVVDIALVGGSPPSVLDVAPTARTALAWIPPAEVWPAVQHIRSAHDPQVRRWRPHVNILFGFAPESRFDAAATLVGAAVADITAFESRLYGVRTFQHRDDATVWLDPAADNATAWQGLYAAIRRHFPRCSERADGFTPHLTLGRVRDGDLTGMAAQLGDQRSMVDSLVLLSRRADEPMRPRATIELGTGTVTWHDDEDTEDSHAPIVDSRDIDTWVTRIERALGTARLHVTGSRRLGCALPGADIDLVAAVAGEPDLADLEARLGERLSCAPRRVVGARVPGLRLEVGGLSVDLAIVGTGSVDPTEAVARRSDLGSAAAIALSAVSDADTVLASVADRGAEYGQLAVEVKAWARARGLDGAPFGGVPGLGWSVLAALTVRDAPAGATPEVLRELFFATWAGWDWRTSIALDGQPGPASSPVSIYTPSAPVRPLTAQVGPGFRDLLVEELYRAWEIVSDDPTGPWGRLLARPPLHRRHAAWAVVRLLTEESRGRVRGRLRALVTALEDDGVADVHAWPRPFADGTCFAIGLGGVAPTADRLAELARPWLRGLRGVEVTWLDGGEVPTLH